MIITLKNKKKYIIECEDEKEFKDRVDKSESVIVSSNGINIRLNCADIKSITNADKKGDNK